VSDQIGQSIIDIVMVEVREIFQWQLGDVNHNGEIDIVDALITAQYYVGLDPQPFYPKEADVNNNGVIDILDALLIAQAYVGLIELTP